MWVSFYWEGSFFSAFFFVHYNGKFVSLLIKMCRRSLIRLQLETRFGGQITLKVAHGDIFWGFGILKKVLTPRKKIVGNNFSFVF